MLTKIRSGIDHIIVRIILGVIALSFVGFGGVSFMSGNSRGDAVSFSKAESISMEKFFKSKAQKIEAIQNQNQINLTEEQIEELNINQAVLQDLIAAAMLEYIAKQYEFDISDEKIIALAKSSPMFHNANGQFDPLIYKSIFANSKNNEKEYLDFVRNRTIHGTIVGLFSLSYKVPTIMSDNMVNFMSETKNATIYKMDLKFKDKDFNPGNPSRELLEEIYNSNKAVFILPETRSFRYLKVSKEFLLKEVNITEQNMKNYFEENSEEFSNISYAKAKNDIKNQLTAALLDDLVTEFSRKLEDDVAAGMGLEEISKKYSISVKEAKDLSKNSMLKSKNEDYLEIADQVFEMINGEISYPLEIKDKHEIILTMLDSVNPERNREFSEVENDIAKLWKAQQLTNFNMNKFVKFVEDGNFNSNASILAKSGITAIKKPALSRVDLNNNDMPAELLNHIFKIDDKQKTKIFHNIDGYAYFAYLEKSTIDAKKKKMVREKGLEHFQNTIQDSLLQEMIINSTIKNDVKVNLK